MCGRKLDVNIEVSFTGERCDVAIDDSSTPDDDTSDVLDKDDSLEADGNINVHSVLLYKDKLDDVNM